MHLWGSLVKIKRIFHETRIRRISRIEYHLRIRFRTNKSKKIWCVVRLFTIDVTIFHLRMDTSYSRTDICIQLILKNCLEVISSIYSEGNVLWYLRNSSRWDLGLDSPDGTIFDRDLRKRKKEKERVSSATLGIGTYHVPSFDPFIFSHNEISSWKDPSNV